MNKFKKIFVTCSTVAIISGVNIHSAFAMTGTVSSETVRMREEASTSSKIIVNLDIGDKVEIVSEDGDWYKVKYNNYEGYMHKDYVKAEENTDVPHEDESNNEDNTQNNNQNNTSDDNTPADNTDNLDGEEEPSEEVPNEKVPESKITYVGRDINLKNDSDVYLLPVLSSSKINKLPVDTTVRGIQETNNWVKISYSNIEGWVAKSNLPELEQNNVEPPVENNDNNDSEPPVEDNNEQPTETPSTDTPTTTTDSTNNNQKAYINVTFANIRESADSNSDVIISLPENTEVTILGEENDFYKITSEKVKEGYVAKRLVSDTQITSRSSEIRSSDIEENIIDEQEVVSNSSGQEIADFAKQYLGYDYVYGGTNPSNGFDCSGYTYYVYSNNGIDISRNLSAQASLGEEVDEDNIEIGDLIIFMDEGMNGVGHSGIYIGNNQFIHAANPKRGVVTDSMSNDYYGPRIVTIRRVV